MLPFELKQALSSLQSILDSHEKISLASFSKKLDKVAEMNPQDITIGQMVRVVDAMNSGGERLVISRAEVRDLYKKLYTTSSKFATYFADELGIEKEAEQAPSITETEFTPYDVYSANDQAFASELSSLIDPVSTSYSPEAAKDAVAVVATECSYPGLVPVVQIIGGNAEEITVSASYTTPAGIATIQVPVEVIGKRASVPSYFTGKDGSHYISHKSVLGYVRGYFRKAGSFAGVEVAAPVFQIESAEDKEAVESFAMELETPKGVATFQHGELVEAARRVITAKMRGMGKRSAQIRVLDSSDSGITYGVSCSGIAFKVPVKIEAGRMKEPSIIVCRGSVESFDAAGIASLQRESLTDVGVAAAVSPLFDLKPTDLVETVREAASEGNYSKAEDALNVLSESGDAEAYGTAFAEYSAALSGVKKTASTTGAIHTCSRIVRNANSTQPLCGHLNIPLHKVEQDKNGDCITKHQKQVMDSNQGTLFMTSKVFL